MSKTMVIVLNGGVASRMRPLSTDRGKSMIDFMGKPLLLHLVKSLKSYGLSNIVFTSKGKKGEIEEYFSDGIKYDVNIEYYEKWYGTAGTIRKLAGELKSSKMCDNLMIIYGDSLLQVDYKKMLDFHNRIKSLCTILYHRPRFESFKYEYHDKAFEEHGERTNYGVIDINQDKQIVAFVEKPLISQLDNFTNPVANAAVYLIKKDILKYIPQDSLSDFPIDIFPSLLEKKITCFGFDIEDGYRVDIGTIPTYYTAQLAILSGSVDFNIDFPRSEERVWIGNTSIIGTFCKIKEPTLICENSKIGQGTIIEYSIVGNNVHIGNNCSIKKSIILDNVQIGDGVEIAYSIIGDHCSVDNGVILPINTVLGSYCRLGGRKLPMSNSDFIGLIKR